MRLLALCLGISALALVLTGSVYAQGYGYGMGPGMMGGYGGYGMGPGMMGGYGMGPGMMGGYGGYGMGPGMMGGYGGYGMGPGMMGGYGYRGGYGPGYGPHPQNEACQRFLSDTQGLRKELMNKRFEYSEALRNPKATNEELGAIGREIDTLQEKIQARNTQGCWW